MLSSHIPSDALLAIQVATKAATEAALTASRAAAKANAAADAASSAAHVPAHGEISEEIHDNCTDTDHESDATKATAIVDASAGAALEESSDRGGESESGSSRSGTEGIQEAEVQAGGAVQDFVPGISSGDASKPTVEAAAAALQAEVKAGVLEVETPPVLQNPSKSTKPLTVEDKARVEAAELAMNAAMQQQMKRAMQVAAQRLAGEGPPQQAQTLSSSADPAQRRAALRERVRALEASDKHPASGA